MSELDPSPNDRPSTNTGGGAYVAGDVSAGGDFVGRDKIVNARSPREELDDYLREAADAFVEQTRESLNRSEKLTNPYKFLDAYAVQDSDIFFGRRAAADALYEKVTNCRLTVVHAPSGAGKTSLLQAGIGKRLIEENRLPLYVRSLNPTVYEDPVNAIKVALAPPSLQLLRPAILSQVALADFLAIFIGKLNRHRPRELVLVLDQFEELFILPSASAQRQAFVDALAQCYYDANLKLRLVLAVRKDYFSDMTTLEQRLPVIIDNRFRLDPMSRAEVIEAITRPVSSLDANLTFEPALQARLADDLLHGDFELFFLQLYCDKLYRERGDGNEIPLAAYLDLVKDERGLLAAYMQATLDDLSYSDRNLAKRILAKLITEDNTKKPTSAKALANELGLSEREYQHVLTELIKSRLVRRSATDDGYVYELTHDRVAPEIRKWFNWIQPTFEQIELVKAALTSEFDRDGLRMMLQFNLGETIENLVPFSGRNLRQIVADLVYYFACQPNGLQRLILAAYSDKPGNRTLATAVESLKDIQFVPLPRLEDALTVAFSPVFLKDTAYLLLDVDLDHLFRMDALSGRQLVELVVRYFETLPHGLSRLVAAARVHASRSQEFIEVEAMLSKLGRISTAEQDVQLSPLWNLCQLLLEEFDIDALRMFMQVELDTRLDEIVASGSPFHYMTAVLIHYSRLPNGLQQFVEAARTHTASKERSAEFAQLLAQYEQYSSRTLSTGAIALSTAAPDVITSVEDALVSAFNRRELELLTSRQFKRNLYDTAPVDGNLRQIVQALTAEFATHAGGLEQLIAAAQRQNPGNPDLIAVSALLSNKSNAE